MMAAEHLRVIGSPPTLEWISVDRLQVDEAYQRATDGDQSRKIIFGMVKCWDWRLCQPLNVSRRTDGSLFVVDGQHRLTGARQRGDIPHLPCVIASHGDAADEANTFVALNQRRQKLSQGDVFNAMLAAGDADAKRVAELVARAGLTFARHHNSISWKPGQIFCGPGLVKWIRLYGEAAVSNGLVALAEAYPTVVLSRAGTLFPALMLIYSSDALRQGFDPDRFIQALGSLEQLEWLESARTIRAARQALGPREALAEAFMTEYDALADDGSGG